MGAKAIAQIIEDLRRRPSRNWSIVITIFGDAIVPRGGSVWLGTLLDFFRLLGIGEGAVRTAMSRLASDGWLERSRGGRNSYYRLTERGREEFIEATAQIYAARGPDWDGALDVLFVERNGNGGPDSPRARLERAGYGMAAPGVYLAPPGAAPAEPEDPEAIALRLTGDGDAFRRLAATSWPIAEAAEAYRRFAAGFEPLGRAIKAGGRLTEAEAMVARILLIHEYRRLVLRYRALPRELLPPDWPGEAALAMCAELYHALLPPAERWLDRYGRCRDGRLPPADPAIHSRFLRDPARA